MPSRYLKYALFAAPLLLAACGEGYEQIQTTQFPYGNKRTAGTGVAYVVAKMMPEKELKLEPATKPEPKVEPKPEPAPPPKAGPPEPEQPEVLEELQEMFRERQKK